MQVIVEACEASMPRRLTNYHKKPAYWWNEELAGLRRDCNKRRRILQRARRRNQPNVAEMEEAYKEARRTLRIAIQLSKNGCWEKFIGSINQDPWGLPYKIVMGKLSRTRGKSAPSDELSLRGIVEVLFPRGEPRTSFPREANGTAGEPFSIQELKTAASRMSPRKSPGLDGIPNEVIQLMVLKNPQLLLGVRNWF